jgi:general stress protein 26
MAIELTDQMKEEVNNALERRIPCLLATAAADGAPDVAIRGSMMIYDTEHLAYWERSRNESLANLEENNKVVVFFRNPESRAQWRFYGEATIYKQGEEMRETIMKGIIQRELDADPERLGYGVLIRVDRVRQGNNVLMER